MRKERLMVNSTITFAEWIKRAVWLLFLLIIGYLLTASIFSTSYLGGYQYMDYASGESVVNTTHTFYIRDYYFQHILLFALTSFLLVRGTGLKNAEKSVLHKKYFPLMICIAAGIAAAGIVMAGGYAPKSDPQKVLDAASALYHGDYSPLERGAYLFRYPFQMGIFYIFKHCLCCLGRIIMWRFRS